MKIAIASDHGGFEFQESIKQHLIQLGHHLRDFGPRTTDGADYPDLIRPAAEAVARGEYG